MPVGEGVDITTAFTEQGEVNGSAGCNAYSAVYTVGGDAIAIDTPTTTRRTCDQPEGIMQLEVTYLDLIQAAQIFQTNDDELTLNAVMNGEEGIIIFFEREQ